MGHLSIKRKWMNQAVLINGSFIYHTVWFIHWVDENMAPEMRFSSTKWICPTVVTVGLCPEVGWVFIIDYHVFLESGGRHGCASFLDKLSNS